MHSAGMLEMTASESKMLEMTACGHCGRMFMSAADMKTHLLTRCEPSESEGADTLTIKSEADTLANENEAADTITIKNEGGIASPSGLDEVAAMSTEPSEDQFECKVCGVSFATQQDFFTHWKTHDTVKPYHCRYCDKGFTNRQSLRYHEQVLHEGKKPEKNIQCEQCGMFFATNGDMKNHVDRTHLGLKLHKCAICNTSLSSRSILATHMRARHSGERPYACGECDATFTRQHCLKDHMLTHSGEKKHECHLCQRQYGLKSSLTNHLRTFHGGQRYECRHCGKTFSGKKSYYVAHERICNTGEKPFACEDCDASFRMKTSLMAHKQRVHSVGLVCPECGQKWSNARGLAQHRKNEHDYDRKDELLDETPLTDTDMKDKTPLTDTDMNDETPLTDTDMKKDAFNGNSNSMFKA